MATKKIIFFLGVSFQICSGSKYFNGGAELLENGADVVLRFKVVILGYTYFFPSPKY